MGIRRPNLLFILVDQMRYHALGAAGNTQIVTPNLDRLALDGAFCSGAVSNIPVCTPARACLLTGRYPLSHTVLVNNSILPTDIPSLGTCLQAAGYSTGYIGKWHLAGEGYIGCTPLNHGVDGFVPPGPMRHGFEYWAVHHCTHAYRNAVYFRDTPEPMAAGPWEPDTQTDEAIGFLERHQVVGPGHPFALVLSWGTPHTPFIAPEEDLALYDPTTLKLRHNILIPKDEWPHPDSTIPAGCEGDPEATLRLWTANYYAAITNIDRNVGRLLSALERLQLRRDTIVVFTSDHGEMLGSHGQLHKAQPWDESIRVPFIMNCPSLIPGGARIDMPLNQPDVLPTLFGLMGVAVPAGVQGDDLSQVFRGTCPAPERSAFLLWPCSAVTWGKKWTHGEFLGRGMPHGFLREYRGVRTSTTTYVRHRAGDWFLYDNRADPLQLHNLAAIGATVPEDPRRELDHWLQRTDDGFESTHYYMDTIDPRTGECLHPDRLTRDTRDQAG